MTNAAWQSLLNNEFIHHHHPDWAKAESDHATLCALFLEHGVPNLAPLDAGLDFEPSYFIETHPEWEGASEVDCYRAWLQNHSLEPPSAKAHLANLRVPNGEYPSAFPWRFYAELRPAAGANKWIALEDFLEAGFGDIGEKLPYGEGAQNFLVDLARRFSRFHDLLALKAFNLAEGYGVLSPDATQHHADAYLRLGFAAPARAIYKALIDQGAAEPWTVRNYYLSCASMGRRSEAIEPLIKTAPVLRADEVWRNTAHEMIGGLFDDALQVARSEYLNDKRASGDRHVASAVAQIHGILKEIQFSIESAPASGSRVVMFANKGDPYISHYRLAHRSELFAALGRPFTLFEDDWSNFDSALIDACAVIFVQAQARPDALRVLHSVRRRKLPVFYEAYTPIFDPTCAPPAIETFGGYLTTSQHNTLKIDVSLHEAFARLCDFGLAPTDSIARRLQGLVGAGQCWILPDGLGSAEGIWKNPKDNRSDGLVILIESPRFLYFSPEDGGPGEAIFDALCRDNTVRLATSGYVQLDARFDTFDDRILELGPISAPGAHLAGLSGRVLNVALTVDTGDDASSSASWLEAARRAIPSIIDAPGAAAAALRDDKDAFVVQNPRAWRERLIQVIENPAFAVKLGERAHRRALEHRSLQRLAPLLELAIKQERSPNPSWPGQTIKSLLSLKS